MQKLLNHLDLSMVESLNQLKIATKTRTSGNKSDLSTNYILDLLGHSVSVAKGIENHSAAPKRKNSNLRQ